MKNIYYSLLATLCLFITVSCSKDSPTGSESGGEGNSTIMTYQLVVSADPGEAGNVTPASDEYEEGESVELTATPNDDWVFVEWEGDHTGNDNPVSITMDSNKEISALFTKRDYPLTVNTEGEGSVSETVVQEKTTDYEAGTTVEMTATPAEGWTFVEWKGDVEGDESTATITVDGEKEVTAVFERKKYPLTVNTEGEGTVAEEVVQAKTTEYSYETNLELTATPAEGWTFVEWKGDVTGTENPATITVDDAKEVTAIFERKDYPLTVNTEGEGTVNEKVVQAKTTDYESGTEVELTAEAVEGWTFVEWKGDIAGNENPATITVDGEKEVSAVFEKDFFELTLVQEGEGGVTEELISGNKSGEGLYGFESDVELTATAENGWEFDGWSGKVTGNENPITLKIGSENTVTATFIREEYSLTKSTVGNGTVEESLISGTETENGYLFESEVELTAQAETGWGFKQWQGDLTGSDTPETLVMDEEKEVIAVFEELDFYLAENGVTVMCPNANTGDTGTVLGTTYTKRSSGDITPDNAATTCTSGITDMKEMFYDETDFNEDISSWDVSNVTDMSIMFYSPKFNQDISYWDVSSVTNMGKMFYGAEAFNQNISDWDVSSVTDMSNMFSYARSFDQPIGGWDVSSVMDMSLMFWYAAAFDQPIGDWDVSSVTDMSNMFSFATSFDQPIGGWDVSSIRDMKYMFAAAAAFNQPIGGWDVSDVTNMNSMFGDATSFDQPIGDWNVSNVTDMDFMFYRAATFNQDIGGWDVSNVTTVNFMFGDASNFYQDLSSWCVILIPPTPSTFYIGAGFEGDMALHPQWGEPCTGS